MKLYEIDAAIMDCITVDEETGEVTIDEERMNALQMERDKKIEWLACERKNRTSLIAAIKANIETEKKRVEQLEKSVTGLDSFLVYACEGKRFQTALCDVTFRNTESVQIAPDAVVPEEFVRVKVKEERTPDKVALKAALKEGQEFKGIALEKKTSVTIK